MAPLGLDFRRMVFRNLVQGLRQATIELRGAECLDEECGLVVRTNEIGRMPDFLGGAAHVGVWLENGDAFNDWSKLSWRTHVTTGLIVDTLIGPMLLGTTLPAHVLTPSVTARGILNMTALAVVEAQRLAEARG